MPRSRSEPDPTCLAERYESFCQTHPVRFLVVNGHRWPYREGGAVNNPAILMLPGALGRPETGFEYFAAFEKRFRVIAPGYPDTVGSMSGLADGCAALLDAQRIARAHVVGGSFGGLVAQTILERHPDRIGRLVLSDTSPPVRTRTLRMRLCAELIRVLPPRLVKNIVRFGVGRYVATLPPASRRFWHTHFGEMLQSLNKGEIENRARAWIEFDQTPYTSSTFHPVLVLCAESDSAVSPRAFLRRFPQAVVHCVASPLGHAASVGDATAYLAPMCAFLAEGDV